MYCSKCGTNNQDSDKYCTNCGQLLQPVKVTYSDNPYGVEYNSSNNVDDVFLSITHNTHIPTVAKTRPARARGFVLWASIAMAIVSFFIFFSWTMTSFSLFSGIVVDDNIVSKDIPSEFSVYQSLHIAGVLLSLSVCVLCGIIAVSTKSNQQIQELNKSISDQKTKRKKVLYCVMMVCLTALIIVASITYAYEYIITQQLLSQGWTSVQIAQYLSMRAIEQADTGVETVDVGTFAIIVNTVLITVQYIWQWVFGIIGLLKVTKAIKRA